MDDLFAILLGAGVAGGALYLLHRKQEAAANGFCEKAAAAAEKLSPGSGGAALAACKALDAIKDAIVIDWNKRDADNKALNGEVEIPLSGALARRTVSPLRANEPALRGTVARFKNGCSPFAGTPGWSKCKQGTHSMVLSGGTKTHKLGQPGALVQTNWGGAFGQREGDPFTQGPYNTGGQITMNVDTPTGGRVVLKLPDTFVEPLAPGKQGWFAGGRPFVCDDGVQPAFGVRDQRGELGVPSCGQSPWEGAKPSPILGTATVQTQLSCGPNNTAPAGYTWDTSAGVGFWRRLADGELPNAGPCGASSPKATTLLTPILGVIR